MKTIGAIPKDSDVKEVIDLKEVEPNNSFYDKEVSKEKEPISKPIKKVKKNK